MFVSGISKASLSDDDDDMLCKACIVDDCGGVFSPRMLCDRGRRRAVGRTIGVQLGPGTGVEQAESLTGDRESVDVDVGVVGLLDDPPSIIKLKSRTEPGCSDCIRRWDPPFTSERSGEPSLPRLVNDGGSAVSRATRSLSAACAD